MAGLATQDVLARTRAFNEAGVAASRAKRLQKERAQAASASGERDERKLRAEDYYDAVDDVLQVPELLGKKARAARARGRARVWTRLDVRSLLLSQANDKPKLRVNARSVNGRQVVPSQRTAESGGCFRRC